MRLLDSEVRRILDEAYDEAVDLLAKNREKLDALASALLDKETLEEAEAYAVAGISREDPDSIPPDDTPIISAEPPGEAQ